METLNLSAVTQGVEALLENADLVGKSGVAVVRSEEEPTDPPSEGWVGIFKTEQRFPMVAAGNGQRGRNHQIDVVLMLVQTHETGDQCEDALNVLTKNVMDVVLEDGSLASNVDYIEDVVVKYPDYRRDESKNYRQTAFIFLTGIKRI